MLNSESFTCVMCFFREALYYPCLRVLKKNETLYETFVSPCGARV